MKIDKETGLKPCPFCSSNDVHIGGTLGMKPFWVRCDNCHADGPIKDTEGDAIAAWNRRYDPEVDDGR